MVSKISLVCSFCDIKFDREKTRFHKSATRHYCSISCARKGQSKYGRELVKCKNCDKEISKVKSRSKISKNLFCSLSCANKYNNTHKTKGNNRSKLEIWIEKQLGLLYPNLEIWFNHQKTFGTELDIYIPSLKLAFELNGIFHYEPIFGSEKLTKTQNNDNRKFQACLERGIELCIIDTTSQHYFKERTSQKFLNIIINIINSKLG